MSLDFLTEATCEKMNQSYRTQLRNNKLFDNSLSKDMMEMNKFKELFFRLPQEYQNILIEEAQKALDEEDRIKEEKEKKNAEALLKSSSVLGDQKALDMKEKLRLKLLKKKGLIK